MSKAVGSRKVSKKVFQRKVGPLKSHRHPGCMFRKSGMGTDRRIPPRSLQYSTGSSYCWKDGEAFYLKLYRAYGFRAFPQYYSVAILKSLQLTFGRISISWSNASWPSTVFSFKVSYRVGRILTLNSCWCSFIARIDPIDDSWIQVWNPFFLSFFFSFLNVECPPAEDGMERFACPTPDIVGRYRCIDDHVLCDGFIDCPGGEDEDGQACMFYKTVRLAYTIQSFCARIVQVPHNIVFPLNVLVWL